MCIPSSLDPTLAPPGCHVLSLFIQYTPYHLKDGTWTDEKRNAYADKGEHCKSLSLLWNMPRIRFISWSGISNQFTTLLTVFWFKNTTLPLCEPPPSPISIKLLSPPPPFTVIETRFSLIRLIVTLSVAWREWLLSVSRILFHHWVVDIQIH